ncbi:hypothetical protein SNE40_016810 [Patella caerulea]|uniref:Cyclin-like domain-containing protein n=2 Tax=Patella caerulea TaxID=87958 RepID=A0AAN8PCW8_PATCE
MKLHSGMTARSLARLLGEAINKEQKNWKPIEYKPTDMITSEHRDEGVIWLLNLFNKFRFSPETFGAAVGILDKFISLVKVPPKYLRCVTITCLYLAAKTLEEDDIVPSTQIFARISGCGCSLSEILRMELVILKKLCWSLPTTSSIDVLHIIHTVLLQHHPHLLDGLKDMTPSRHMSIITRKLLTCLGQHRLLMFPPITVVVSMLSLELEQMTSAWFPLIALLQRMTNIDNQKLIHCREVIASYLSSVRMSVTPYQKIVPQKSKKRKVEQIDDDDDIYDSIKRLYNEDHIMEIPTIHGSCSSELHQNTEETFSVHTVCAN